MLRFRSVDAPWEGSNVTPSEFEQLESEVDVREKRVLIVDDEPKIRELMSGILEEEGLFTMRAGSVDEALQWLDTSVVDLVLTDLSMPERTGIDLVRQLRESFPQIPSVIITGYASTDTAIEALRLGVSDYLKKPFHLDALKNVVRKVLGQRARTEATEAWQRDVDAETERSRTEEERLRSEVEAASRALEGAERRIERRSAILRLVERIQSRSSSSYDLDEFLAESLVPVCTELEAIRGSIHLVEASGVGPRLVVHAAFGPGDTSSLIGQRSPMGEGVAGWVAANKRCLRIDDIHADDRFPPQNPAKYRTPSCLSVPLVHNDDVTGVLNLSDRENLGPFTSEDEELARIVGTALAGAVQNQRLADVTRGHQLATTRALVDSLEAKDPFIRGHSSRVTEHALRIAEQLALSDEECKILYYGGHLHDIGKIGVPERILQKPGALTDDEFQAIALHPEIGARLLRRLTFLEEVKPIVRHHHERWDGRGYPDGLSGEQIPLLASVVSIADAFDAMTSGRSYRDPLELDEARDEIRRHRATQFRPDVVDAFLRISDFRSRAARPSP